MFARVLVANRGEVARRVIATCRRLGVETVAVFSDADAGAAHVEEADSAFRLGPAPLAQSYLNQEALLSALAASGADAVHPGYGLLSENSTFAARVRETGAAFVGPSDAALAVFGDKLRARALAKSLGVMPPPGTEQAVDAASEAALRRIAEPIGLPLLVKATGGGGGIGMLIVERWEDLPRAARQCSERGQSAFGDPRIYIEKLLSSPRHVEVQVLADHAGRCQVLGERECSVQRRHQKLIEESPSEAPFLESPDARDALYDSARRIIESQGYAGLATVEFVVDEGGTPYFLEVNPRLQVEHGVTEMTYGVDLVQHQLEAAAGVPCSLSEAPEPRGHAIEVRVYAEDPKKKFMPQPGELARFRFPAAGPDLRIETGFREGETVTPYYDPLLAKLVTFASTRSDAIARMDAALAGSDVAIEGKLGPKQTNLGLLREVLGCESFRRGRYSTQLVSELGY